MYQIGLFSIVSRWGIIKIQSQKLLDKLILVVESFIYVYDLRDQLIEEWVCDLEEIIEKSYLMNESVIIRISPADRVLHRR